MGQEREDNARVHLADFNLVCVCWQLEASVHGGQQGGFRTHNGRRSLEIVVDDEQVVHGCALTITLQRRIPLAAIHIQVGEMATTQDSKDVGRDQADLDQVALDRQNLARG